jgi:hypothetical protein
MKKELETSQRIELTLQANRGKMCLGLTGRWVNVPRRRDGSGHLVQGWH